MKPTLQRLFLCAAICASPAAFAVPTLVQDVRVFDGKAVHERRSVLFDRGLIVDADFKGKAPAGSRVVERRRAHAAARPDRRPHPRLPRAGTAGAVRRDDPDRHVHRRAMMQKAKQEMAQGGNHAPAPTCSRPAPWSRRRTATAPSSASPSRPSRGPEQAQAFVDARIAEGSDFIKIVMESGYGFPSLDMATAKAVIEAAHRRGKLAVVHIGNEKDARAVLEAGADGLVHLFPGRRADATAAGSAGARRKGAFVIPTFTVLESMAGWRGDDLLANPAFAGLLDKDGAGPAQGALRQHGAAGQLAGAEGGGQGDAGRRRAAAGRDRRRQPGHPVRRQHAPRTGGAGRSRLDAARRRWRRPPACRRTPSSWGGAAASTKGYKADLLLVDGDPTADIRATRRIVEVWKDGESANGLRDAQRQQVAKSAAAGRQGARAAARRAHQPVQRGAAGQPVRHGLGAVDRQFRGRQVERRMAAGAGAGRRPGAAGDRRPTWRRACRSPGPAWPSCRARRRCRQPTCPPPRWCASGRAATARPTS